MGNDWPLVKLGDFVQILTGHPFKSKDYSEHEGIRLLRGDNIAQGTLRWQNVKLLPQEKIGEKEHNYFLRTGDVILAMDRPWIEAGLKTAQINENDLPCLLVQRVACLRCEDPSDQDFIRYIISSYGFVQYVKLIQTGTAVPHISGKQIKDYEFRLPPKSVRKQIGRIVKQLDDKANLNRQINQTLEQMAQALFKSWFVDFDPVIDNALDAGFFEQDWPIPDELQHRAEARKAVRESESFKPLPDEVRQLFPDAFEESELGWVPKGWKPSNVGAEFDVTMGQSPPGSTYNELGIGIPFFQGKTDFGFRYPTNRIFCSEPKRLAEKADTLISVRAPVGDINLAAENCAIGRGLAAARHKSGSPSFTYYAMSNLSTHFEVFEGEGTVFGSINQKDFKALPQIKVTTDVVAKFDEHCGVWDKKIEIVSEQIGNLTKLRDTLLPKLISGELRLDDIELAVE